ncbi:MAG: hypothetical protein ABFD79_04465 [Phycisphaerales bacterium]
MKNFWNTLEMSLREVSSGFCRAETTKQSQSLKLNVFFRFILLLFISSNVFALTLTGNQTRLTNPSAMPGILTSQFSSAANLLVWIDARQNAANTDCVYVSFLNDVSHTEYLIDSVDSEIAEIKTDGRYIAYTVFTETGQTLRIADTINIAAPAIKEITGNFIEGFDIGSGVLVFRESANYDLSQPQTIYAVSLSDPSLTKHKIKEFLANDYIYTNIALDSRTIVWSGEYYDDVNSIYSNYLDIADINVLTNPIVVRNYLPKNSQDRYSAWINYLDISNNWLIARGTYNDTECVFGLQNFKTPSAWSFVQIRSLQNYDIKPMIDYPFVVWAESTNNQPGLMEYTEPSNCIIGAVLLDNGWAPTSIIKNQTQPDETIASAVINNGSVIWSAAGETSSGIFTDNLQLQCGDNGYMHGDLNKDCKIDFQDLAKFSENWLACTNPNGDTCLLGEIF